MVLFSCPINVLFLFFFLFFKCSPNFRAHNLQSELNNVWYTNFVKFWLQSMRSKIERTFKKTIKYVFVLILPTPSLPSFFCTFFLTLEKDYFIYSIFTKFMWWIPIKKIWKTVIKLFRNLIFKKSILPVKPTWRFCFFSFSLKRPKTKAEPPNI